jgi:hypothetical protein
MLSGVDYFGMHILSALRDTERFRALAQPFRSDKGNQYFLEIVLLQSPRGGILASEDPLNDLLVRCPHLKPHITPSSYVRYKCGDRVPDPATGSVSFFASIGVFSRVSRRESRLLANEVRSEFRYEFV